jgi:hypothetical protein
MKYIFILVFFFVKFNFISQIQKDNFNNFKFFISKNIKDSALFYFDKWSLNKTSDSLVRVYVDSELDNYNNLLNQYGIEDFIKEVYLKEIPKVQYPNFSFILWKFGAYDQRSRTLSKYDNSESKKKEQKYLDSIFVKNPAEYFKINDSVISIRKKNEKVIIDWVKLNGWPNYSKVGSKASEAAFFVIQHSINLEYYNICLNYLKKDLKLNEINPYHYACMYDRNLIHRNKKQYYGTQSNNKTGIYKLDEVYRPKKLNQRRKRIGLESIENFQK